MTPESVMAIGKGAVEVMLIVSAPMLITALVVGLVISIFQAATQINEQTLSFIPKLIAVFVMMLLAGPWMLSVLSEYMRNTIMSIPSIIG